MIGSATPHRRMTISDRRRIATRTLANAGAFPSDACGALHPPEPAPAGTGLAEPII
jgi:hypothetical protein